MSWNAANIWKKIHMERRLSCWVNYHRMRRSRGRFIWTGRQPGESLARRLRRNRAPIFLSGSLQITHISARRGDEAGADGGAGKQGFSYTIVPRGTDDTYRSVIEKTVYPGSGTAVVAALDFASTAEAAEIVGGSSVYGKYISGLYGVGMMPSLLDQLDKGTIRGLVVTNQFDAGYFAVKKAVQAD